jgi:hypothetical protein
MSILEILTYPFSDLKTTPPMEPCDPCPDELDI